MGNADDLMLPCPVRYLEDADVPRWLADVSEVFTVFARQDSGNVGYGVRLSVGRVFVKHLSSANAVTAVPRLRALHSAVQHPVIAPVTQIVPTRADPMPAFGLAPCRTS